MAKDVAVVDNTNAIALAERSHSVASIMTGAKISKTELFNITEEPLMLEKVFTDMENAGEKRELTLNLVGVFYDPNHRIKGNVIDAFYLITNDKKAYLAHATVLTRSLERFYAVAGLPETWQKPLKVMIKPKRLELGETYGIKLLSEI